MISIKNACEIQKVKKRLPAGFPDHVTNYTEAGLAWHYRKYQKEKISSDRELYLKEEIGVREVGRGLWYGSAAVPPWEHQK